MHCRIILAQIVLGKQAAVDICSKKTVLIFSNLSPNLLEISINL